MPGENRAKRRHACDGRLLGAVFDNAVFGVAYIDEKSRWLHVNQHLLADTGYVREELMSMTVLDLIGPRDAETVRGRLEQIWGRALESYRIETCIRKRGGDRIWVEITFSLEKNEADVPIAVLVIVQDIELRKAAEERQQLLVAELHHRVRNTLATVQSIAAQTLRHSNNPDRFVENFRARIHALSSAHDVLTQSAWDGADLATLIKGQVTVAGGSAEDRVRCHGPKIVLPPRIALNLSLALHELAANAIQHGALSTDDGRIGVTWTVDLEGDTPVLTLIWRETGGPPTKTPEYAGFGTLMLERGVTRGLDATTRLSWEEGGLVVELAIPVARHPRNEEFFKP